MRNETAARAQTVDVSRSPAGAAATTIGGEERDCRPSADGRRVPVAGRGGSHNVAGAAVCDGGLVIDFSERRTVAVDDAARTATAEAGATWYDFDQATQGFGLATTGGLVSSTGIAGFTLGGGIGWLVRKHGLACDNPGPCGGCDGGRPGAGREPRR